VAEALDRVRSSKLEPNVTALIFVVNDHGPHRLRRPQHLLEASSDAPLRDVEQFGTQPLYPD
jgi:Mg/Co/Ni transporter MgtE